MIGRTRAWFLLLVAPAGCFAASSGGSTPDAGFTGPPDGEFTDSPIDEAGPDASPVVDATTDVVDATADAAADVSAVDSSAPHDSSVTDVVEAATPEAAAPETGTPDADVCATCTGTCTSGECLVTFVPYAPATYAMFADSTALYWTEAQGGRVRKADLSGSPIVTLYTGAEPTYLAHDPASVYFTDLAAGTVASVPLDGGSATTLQSNADVDAGVNRPGAIAVDSANVYWVDRSTVVTTDSVLSEPIGGGAITTLTSGLALNSIVVQGATLYLGGDPGLLSLPVTGGTPTTLVQPGSSNPRSMVVDATNAYWVDEWGSAVWQAPLTGIPDGGAPLQLAAAYETDCVAVDAANVYFATGVLGSAAGTVMRVPIGGGTAVTLASLPNTSDPSGLCAMAVDATSVYFSYYDTSAGQVWKLTPK